MLNDVERINDIYFLLTVDYQGIFNIIISNKRSVKLRLYLYVFRKLNVRKMFNGSCDGLEEYFTNKSSQKNNYSNMHSPRK